MNKILSPFTVWRHKESGDLYDVLMVANEEAKDKEKWPNIVIYTKHADNELEPFARPEKDFLEKMTFVSRI